MNEAAARRRAELIRNLRAMNFVGPVHSFGCDFMIYHGQLLALPAHSRLSVAQFRFFLQELEGIVSKSEWNF